MCVCNYYFDSRFCWFCGAAALLRGTDVAGDPATGVFPEPCARREVGLAADPGSAFRRSPRAVAGDRVLAEIANPGDAIIAVNSSAISPPTRAWVSVGSAAWQPAPELLIREQRVDGDEPRWGGAEAAAGRGGRAPAVHSGAGLSFLSPRLGRGEGGGREEC